MPPNPNPWAADWPEQFRRYHEGYFSENPSHDWPAEKFGMDKQDVFTVLAPRFNTTTIALLDTNAFCRDVAYLSTIARDCDELFRLLSERRDIRHEEIKRLFLVSVQGLFQGAPIELLDMQQYADLWKVVYYGSFDSITSFFANFLPKNRRARPQPPPQAQPDPPLPPAPLATRAESETPSFVTAPSRASSAEPQAPARPMRTATKPPRRAAVRAQPNQAGGLSRTSGSRVQKRTRAPKSSRRTRRRPQQSPALQTGDDKTQTSSSSPLPPTPTAAPPPASAATSTHGKKRKRDQQRDEADCGPAQPQEAESRGFYPENKRRKTQAAANTSPPYSAGATSVGPPAEGGSSSNSGSGRDDADQAYTLQAGERRAGERTRKPAAAGARRARASSGKTSSLGRSPQVLPATAVRNNRAPRTRRVSHSEQKTAHAHGHARPGREEWSHPPPPSPPPPGPTLSRVTRAQRQRLSQGGDAQLVRLGEGGKAEVQPGTHISSRPRRQEHKRQRMSRNAGHPGM